MGKSPLMFSADHLKSHFQQIVSLLWSVGGNLLLGTINLTGPAPLCVPFAEPVMLDKRAGPANQCRHFIVSSESSSILRATSGRDLLPERVPSMVFVRSGQNELVFGALFTGAAPSPPRPNPVASPFAAHMQQQRWGWALGDFQGRERHVKQWTGAREHSAHLPDVFLPILLPLHFVKIHFSQEICYGWKFSTQSARRNRQPG